MLSSEGYVIPRIEGGYYYKRPWLHSERAGEAPQYVPDPPTYEVRPCTGHTYILGTGPSYKDVKPEIGSRVVLVNHAELLRTVEGIDWIHICQDWHPWKRRQHATIISDQLIPYYMNHNYPRYLIPEILLGKFPTIIVACKMFAEPAQGRYSLHGIDAYYDPNAPDHYAIQRDALRPYVQGAKACASTKEK